MEVNVLKKLEEHANVFSKILRESRLEIEDYTVPFDTTRMDRVIENFEADLKLDYKYMDNDLKILEEIRYLTQLNWHVGFNID